MIKYMAEHTSSWGKALKEVSDRAFKTVYFPPKEKSNGSGSAKKSKK